MRILSYGSPHGSVFPGYQVSLFDQTNVTRTFGSLNATTAIATGNYDVQQTSIAPKESVVARKRSHPHVTTERTLRAKSAPQTRP